jgi:hypothetical protein
MKRIREFLESIAYAGLKPGQKSAARKTRWFGEFGAAVDRLVSGSAPSDPLYLSNRSGAKKLKLWVLIGAPCLLLALAIGVALSHILDPNEPKPGPEPSAHEISAKLLPNLATGLSLDGKHDIEVLEVRIEHSSGSRIKGVVRNMTDRDIATAHVVMNLTDISGSQLGGVEANIEQIPASKTKAFSIPIVQQTAAFALVREAAPVK